MEDKQHVQIYAGGTWLGEQLPQYDVLKAKLEELETRQDAIPRDFRPRVFLQFMSTAVQEIKRLTAENHALKEALKGQNQNIDK